VADERRCEQCGSPLDGDQRYCLTCGARAGDRSPGLRELLARIPEGGASEAETPVAEAPAAPGGEERPGLPGPRISALLVAVFVGFGALIGSAAGRDGAAPARQVRLLAPQSQQASTPRTGETSSGDAGGESAEAPELEPEATPSAAPTQASSGAAGSKSGGAQGQTGGGSSGSGSSSAPATPARKLTSIKHVFVVVLSDQPYAANFGPESGGRYVAHTLESKGELLLRYDAIAHEQLPNGIGLLSGQGPTAQTAANCPVFAPLAPASPAANGQVLGSGCIYPQSVETLPGQLEAKHLKWKAYVEGLGESPAQPAPCGRPAPGSPDPTLAGGDYANYRNPFVYFESITAASTCQTADVGLAALKGDLSGPAARTPQFSYIVPNRCHDGSPTPCAAGAPAGPTAASKWLEGIVPQILASKAFKKGGLLIITADEAPSTGEFADSSSCCGQPAYPNYTATEIDHGGGGVGALLLSPFIKGGTISQDSYNHFSLLRTIEDVFGLSHLGYAGLPAIDSFKPSLLNAAAARH
jgi:hypothetical protein